MAVEPPCLKLPMHRLSDRQPSNRGRYLVWDMTGDPATAWWDSNVRTFKQGAVGRSAHWWAGPLPEAPQVEDPL